MLCGNQKGTKAHLSVSIIEYKLFYSEELQIAYKNEIQWALGHWNIITTIFTMKHINYKLETT